MFLLNSVRIAMLAALAAKGHVAVATAGFHSQAGWIFFIARRLPGGGAQPQDPLAAQPTATPLRPSQRRAGRRCSRNATTALLLPLVAVLAAGMLTAR